MRQRYYNEKNSRTRVRSVSRPLPWILLVTAAVLIIAAGQALAGANSSARSMAMGGAFTGLATGIDAGKFNPANLGLTDHRETGIEIVGVGVAVNNNAFTLGDYNEYTGAFLTEADKDDILGKIPVEGLSLVADVEVTTMSFATGPYAFNVTGVGVADVNLSRDIFELVLRGNTFADTIDVNGSRSDMYSYASAGLSYGMPIYGSGTRQLAVGATFKYIRGIAVEEVVELEGMAATLVTGFEGEGHMIARTATGGKGYGLDLGASLKLSKAYTVGARVENVIGSITWNNETEEHGYLFQFDTMTVDNMEDDYVTSEDYTKDIGSFSTSLPRVLTVGIAKTSGKLLWALDWEQGLQNKPGSSTTPLVSAGVEYSLVSFLPLRAGFMTGGDRNTSLSAGSGFNFNPFYLDFAIATGSSMSGNSSKGANFAVSMGLNF